MDDSDRDRLREIQRQFLTDDPNFARVFRTARERTSQGGDLGVGHTGCAVSLLVFSLLSLLAGQIALAAVLLVLVVLVWKAKHT